MGPLLLCGGRCHARRRLPAQLRRRWSGGGGRGGLRHDGLVGRGVWVRARLSATSCLCLWPGPFLKFEKFFVMKATALELEACYDVRPLAGVRVPLASLKGMIGRRALDPGQQLLALVLGPQRGLPIFSGSGVSGSQPLTGWGCSCTESGKCVQFVEPCPAMLLLLKFDLVFERQQKRAWGFLLLPATCICAMGFAGRPLPLLSFPVANPNDLHSAKALPSLWCLSGSERALCWASCSKDSQG